MADFATTEYVEAVIDQAETIPSATTTTEYVETVIDQPETVPAATATTTYVEIIIANNKAYWGILAQ